MYVEPDLLARGPGGRVLVAGTYHHVLKRDTTGRWVLVDGQNIFGAVLDTAGAVRIVPAPIPQSAIAGPRAVARGADSWSVGFVEIGVAEIGKGITQPDSREVRGLWHGELRGVDWVALERLPLPEGQVDTFVDPSSLILHDGLLTWAVVVRTSAGLHRAVVLEQGQDGWTSYALPPLFAWEPDLARGTDGQLLLALVYPDPTLPSDGNSLFLWRRAETWTSLGKLIASQEERVNHPAFGTGAERTVLSWEAVPAGARHSELHAMVDPERVPRPPVLTVDPHISFDSPHAPIRLGDEYFFVTDHVLDGSQHELRLNRLTRDEVQLVSAQRFESVIPFGAGAADDSTVVVVRATGETGIGVLALYPNVFFLPTYTVIYPEVLRFRVTCARRGP